MLKGKLTLFASRDDYALQTSRRLFGDKIRAGENTDLAQFKALGIEAHDLSNVEGGVGKITARSSPMQTALRRWGQR